MTSTNSSGPDRWAMYGFTTTPEERIGPGPPYTTPALQANLFFRVFLGMISLFVTWVPARLLWRNGEFAGTVLCVMLLINNLTTVVSALIWRDNNVKEWWVGYGWCDIQAYAYFALHSAFNISLFEVMRGLAAKVSLNRAVKPTRSEMRRQRIISALVIFTVPVIQVILTYFAAASRYNVATLVGCNAVYYPNWVYLVFYLLPTPIFAILAAYAAGLAFYRYRKIDRATRDISRSQGGEAAARQHRVRVKLYFMTLVAIIIVLPLILVLLFSYVVAGAPWDLSYDFDAIHYGPDPFNMYFISFTTSDKLSFANLNTAYIGEIAGIAVFIPFGTTAEALNMYRRMLLAVGLGYCFPKLREEYVPRPKSSSRSSWRSITRPLRGKSLLGTNTTSTRKDSLLPTVEQVSLASRTTRERSSLTHAPPADLTTVAVGAGLPQYPDRAAASAHHNPWPDLSAGELDAATAQLAASPAPQSSRNPYAMLPSTYTKPPKFPALSITSLRTHRHRQAPPHTPSASSLPAPDDPSYPVPQNETASPAASTSTPAPNKTGTPRPREERQTPWSPAPHGPAGMGVDTRVWADTHTNSSTGTGTSTSTSTGVTERSKQGKTATTTTAASDTAPPPPTTMTTMTTAGTTGMCSAGKTGTTAAYSAGTSPFGTGTGGVRVETCIALRRSGLGDLDGSSFDSDSGEGRRGGVGGPVSGGASAGALAGGKEDGRDGYGDGRDIGREEAGLDWDKRGDALRGGGEGYAAPLVKGSRSSTAAS